MSRDQGAGELPAGTVTFVLTDLEGSSVLWEAEPDAMTAAVVRHYEILDTTIARHGGVRPVEQGEGDSVVAAFSRGSSALACALDVQRAFAAEPWPTSRPLRVRVAVHSGETQLRGTSNYLGQAIVRAARLRAIGHGGQILVSSTAHDLCLDSIAGDVRLADLGVHRLKDLARPEHVWQVTHADLACEFPPLLSIDSLPNNLPVPLSSFIGRQEESETVGRLLREHRMVSLIGVGGAGKTRLAQYVAAEALESFSDGVWWVDLAPLSDEDAIARAIAASVGVSQTASGELLEVIAHRAKNRRMLVVLDNCEHLADAVAVLAQSLLMRCPQLSILATTRAALDIGGEVSWRVPPMELPSDETAVPVDELAACDAVQLFVERARRVRPNFELSPDDAYIVAGICRDLDGVPLAIELAAARCRSLQPAQIATGLADSMRLLTGGGRGTAKRQATLEASIAWSHDLLTEPERVLMRRLSVFVGGFTLDAAEAVAADGVLLHPYAVLDLLDRLIDQSLVALDDTSAAGARYRILETTRQFGARQLADSGEADATRDRCSSYFLAFAQEQAYRTWGSDRAAALDLVAADAANVSRMLAALAARGDFDTLAHVTGCLTSYWGDRDLREAGRWLDLALDADPPIGPRARAAALMARAQLSLLARDLRQATQDSFDYLRVAEEAGLDACVADARAMLGLSCMFHDQSAAREHFAIARAHLHDDARGFLDGHDHDFRRAIILGIEVGCASVGWFSDDVAEWSAAVEALSQNARTAQDAGTAATAEANLARRNAQYAKALTAAERALRPDTYDRSQLQLAETIVAEVAIDTQQPSPTLDTLVDLASRALDDGYLLGWVNLQAALLRHRATQGDLAVASEADEFVTVLMKAGASFALFQLPWLIALHQASSNIAAAEQWLLDGRALLAKAPNGRVAALLDLREASLAIGHGDAKLADQCTRAALTAADDINCPQEIVDAFEMLTIIAATYESWTEAARLHGISARSRDTLGYRLVQEPEHSRLDRALRDARAALGDGAFDAAAAEGRQLSPGDAIAYVERARGERRRPRHGWDSITPTEHQVIELAAEGLTNAQIATRLIMGQETVKTHLSSVYTKLGVSRRAQLATQLAARVHELPSTVRGR